MTLQELKELHKEVIEHWEENYQASLDNDEEKYSVGVSFCAFCQKFHKLNCTICPIAIFSNDVCCANTPYEDISFNRPDTVKAELDFLKALSIEKIYYENEEEYKRIKNENI